MVTYRMLRKGMVKFGARSRKMEMDTIETFETHTFTAAMDMMAIWLGSGERRVEIYVKDDDEEGA